MRHWTNPFLGSGRAHDERARDGADQGEPAGRLSGRQLHTENLVLFAKDVADGAGGKLQVTVHANASLFKAPRSSARLRLARPRPARC